MERGLPAWSPRRATGGAVTQRAYARRGEITAEMEFVALREGVARSFVRDELAARYTQALKSLLRIRQWTPFTSSTTWEMTKSAAALR
ncbi:MAG: thiamine biosynthesis protein ThiC [Streptosporangiaceae bacterium]|nr:thiamine biosynthesis protein ThiC [Streptosporangiaceae bacterium]